MTHFWIIENGSVYDWLHREPENIKKRKSLDWETRLKIIVGLDQGVEYLNHDCVPKIIHKDIKSWLVVKRDEEQIVWNGYNDLGIDIFFIIAVQTPGSEISILLAVGTPSTGSGNLYCQWELSPGMVLVLTRNQSKNVGNVARLVTSKGITVLVKRTTQMLVVRERGLRTETKVDAIAWWIDSGATTHVCKDPCWFKTFDLVEDGSVLYMGDEHFTPVHGKGSVALESSSIKTVTLFKMLYVLNVIRT
nr:LRR receptor-like serine/threonine-protein kinase GSO1 [Tanacetum cinerariifolium]